MERLTKTVNGVVTYIGTGNKFGKWMLPAELSRCQIRAVMKRLAAYEDTGMEPEEINDMALEVATLKTIESMYDGFGKPDHIRDLLQAEQDGRLVVLPCKVGDSIYIPDLEKKIPVKVRVQGISISVSGRTILHFGGYPVECAWGDGCGKDWFFTRDEAEAALAQEGGTNEDSGGL